MNNVCIIYFSEHKGNTKKVIEEMAKVRNIDLIDIKEVEKVNLSQYEYIGFASGIYFSQMNKELVHILKNINYLKEQKTFIIYTCSIRYKNYAKKLENILKQKEVENVGTFCCKGCNTNGICKLISGTAKKHPNKKDLKRATDFIKSIIPEKTNDEK